MVKVELPRGSWELIMLMLHENQSHSPLAHGMYKEIEDQVYSQEY